jgi:hypothetical protein
VVGGSDEGAADVERVKGQLLVGMGWSSSWVSGCVSYASAQGSTLAFFSRPFARPSSRFILHPPHLQHTLVVSITQPCLLIALISDLCLPLLSFLSRFRCLLRI